VTRSITKEYTSSLCGTWMSKPSCAGLPSSEMLCIPKQCPLTCDVPALAAFVAAASCLNCNGSFDLFNLTANCKRGKEVHWWHRTNGRSSLPGIGRPGSIWVRTRTLPGPGFFAKFGQIQTVRTNVVFPDQLSRNCLENMPNV
jgi:hypothetical protein